MPHAIHPRDIAPASARSVGASFTADRSGSAWAVYQNTSWVGRDGHDGDCTRLAEGLSETDARGLAAELSQAVANTHPSDREAVLAYLMEHAALGLGVIRGKAGAAEAVYMLADKMAVAS